MAGAARKLEGDNPSQYPENSRIIECPSSVLHGIRADVLERFNSQPHGGTELFGVLFGTHNGADVVVTGFRTLAAENAPGGSVELSDAELSDAERMAFARAMAAGTHENVAALGWFRSHPRSDLTLSERDLEIANSLFPQPWQVTLILRPGNTVMSRCRIFFRESEGPLPAGAGFQEFTVEPAAVEIPTEFDASMTEALPVADAEPLPDTQPQRDAFPPLAEGLGIEDATPETPPPTGAHVPRRGVALGWPVALTVIACLVAALYWFGRPSERLALRVFDNAGQLRISWDRNLKPLQKGQNAHLEITDGSAMAWMELDHEQLRDGNVTYMRHSNNVMVRLVVPRAGAAPMEEVARFLGSVGHPPPGALEQTQSGSASRVRSPQPGAMGPMPQKPAELVVSVPVEPATTGEIRPNSSAPPVAPPTAAANKPPEPAPTVPAQQPATTARDTTSATLQPSSHAELPVEKPAPPRIPVTSSPQPLASSSSPAASSQTTLLPAGPPVQNPVRAAPAARPPAALASGRVIWIGRLQKNQTLILTGKNCSIGTISGELPTRPFKFSLSPGDLSSDGIVLYTSNSQYANNVVEPPGAGNGWNKTVYTWNPKFASDVTVQEPPSPQNEWRVTLRSRNPKISVIVIDWALVN